MQPKRILLVGLVVVLSATPLFFLLSDPKASETPSPSMEYLPEEPVSEGLASVEKTAQAEATAAPARSHIFIADASGTLESVMQARRTEGSLTYTSRLYPTLGSFVESIGGLENAGGSYWMLYINGELSSSGMSQAQVERGDQIEWRYE